MKKQMYCILLLCFYTPCTLGVPLELFFPFGSDAGDSELEPNDDGSIQFIAASSGANFVFFGEVYNDSDVYINNNGVISFGSAFRAFTPEEFPLNHTYIPPLIAPYWADVDTRGTGRVWFRNTTQIQQLLKVRDILVNAFGPHLSNFNAVEFLLIVTWDRVGYFSSNTDKTNTFQCILASDGSLSFVIFLYADGGIQWTTGDASDGINGLGGTQAQAGFDAGNGVDYVLVNGSFTDDIINIDKKSNVDQPGMFVFQVNDGDIAPPPPAVLIISPWYGHTFGGVPISVSGPVFKEDDVIICLFDDIEVDGVVVNNGTEAICPSPQLIKEPGTRVEFKLKINNIKYEYTAAYYPLSLEDTGEVKIGSSDTLLFYQNNRVSLSWDPITLRKSVADLIGDDHEVVVDIRAFKINQTTHQLNEIGILASEQPNTGSATVTFENLDSAIDSRMITVFVQPTVTTIPTSKRFIQFIPALLKIGKWARIGFLVRRLSCFAWLATEPTSVGEEILEKVREEFPCPPTYDRALAPNSGLELDNRLIQIFHPRAKNCFRQLSGTEWRTNGYGNQCCYGNNDNLIVGPNSGGTVDKVAPSRSKIAHFWEDVLPFLMCCPKHCDEYYKRRPSDDGTAYMDPPRPPPAIFLGDPHIVTLDLYKYTFNGKGEFRLIETNDSSFTVQGRMIEAMSSSNDTLAPATVFSAIVARQFDSDPVQIELYNGELIVLMNGVELDFTVLKVQRFPNFTISYEVNDTVSVSFTEGEFIQVVNTNGFLSTMIVSLPKRFMGKTSGLMGSYNGDMNDDLIPKGSTTPLALNSTIKEIHESFGVTWIIDDPADSLFTYLIGLEWSMFYSPDFTPNYSPVFSDSESEANAKAICGDDLFCLFDIAATGRVDIGMATLQGGINFNILVELSKPVICDPPCANGACVENNTCSCSEGYTGNLCDTTGSSSITGAVVGGTIGGVVGIILITLGVLLLVCIAIRRNKKVAV